MWVWIVIDAASRLFVAFHVGERDEESALKILRIAYDRFFKNPLLVTSDGLAHYIGPVRKWFRGCVYAQVVKRRENNRVVEIVKKIITSHTTREVHNLIEKLGIGLTINTSYVERFNLTLRRGLSSLNRKTLSGAKKTSRLVGDLHIFQTYYNLIRPHMSLVKEGGSGKIKRTPAQAAGFTDHAWTWEELLFFHVPHTKNRH